MVILFEVNMCYSYKKFDFMAFRENKQLGIYIFIGI